MRGSAFVAVLLLVVWGLAPRASAASSAQAVLDRARQASDGARWYKVRDVEIFALIDGQGSHGVSRAIEDAGRGRYVSHSKIDGEDTGEGFDGSRFWTSDASGQVRIEGGGSFARAISAAYRVRRAYLAPPAVGEKRELLPTVGEEGRTYDVVRVTPPGGAPFELWFNRRSHLLARMIEDLGPVVQTERYSDYRRTHGVLLPLMTRVTIGESRFDQYFRVTRVRLMAGVNNAVFAPPPPPPPDYVFPAGADHVDLPFELLNNHIYVEVSIGSNPAHLMMFDTGATGLMDAGAAAELGLKPRGASAVSGGGARTLKGGTLKMPELTLGGVRFFNLPFNVVDLSEQRSVEGVDGSIGILGYEIPKRLVTRIDYAHRVLTLTEPQAARPPAGATALDFEFVGQLAQVNAAINGRPGRFAIDTGSRTSVLLLSDYVKRNGFDRTIVTNERLLGWGLGGPIRAQVGHAVSLELGGIVIRNPVVGLPPPGGPPVDGNIGGAILRRLDLTFDYPHQKIWLRPNAAIDEPDRSDLSGVWINRDGGDFRVFHVEPDSPGAAAGLKVGDVVVSMDGTPASDLRLSDLRDRLKQGGGVEALTIRDSSGSHKAELRLPLN